MASLANIEIVSPDNKKADACILNGCTVTHSADATMRKYIRKYAQHMPVFVTGCYARTTDPHLEDMKNLFFFKTVSELVEYLGSEFSETVKPCRSRPLLKIEEGCDQFCSYCIIPFVRGDSIKSVPLHILEKQLMSMRDAGYREVVITGIHIGKYGAGVKNGPGLEDVVELAFSIMKRVRLGSLETAEVSEGLFNLIKKGRVLSHFHIPIQSGSPAVLEKMNRISDVEMISKTLKNIASSFDFPPAMGTDLIAGFPGETIENFEQTCEFVEKLPFTYGHVFPFSPRRGTVAADMEKTEAVPAGEKKRRAAYLREIFFEKNRLYRLKNRGEVRTMVVESQLAPGVFTGTTDNYITAKIKTDKKLKINQCVEIEIEEISDQGVSAKI